MTDTRTRTALTPAQAVDRRLERVAAPSLRWALALVFFWFGALKVAGGTPVADLVARTVPFVPGDLLVPALGAWEIALGLALATGRWRRVVVAAMVAHLAGTFLVLVTQPELAFQGGNPLLLTMVGEFVVKNVVLIAAGLVVARPDPTTGGDRKSDPR